MSEAAADTGPRALLKAVAQQFEAEHPRPKWALWDDGAIGLGLALLVTSVVTKWFWVFSLGGCLLLIGYVLFFYRAYRARHTYRRMRRIDRAHRSYRKALLAGEPNRAVQATDTSLAVFPELIAPWFFVNDAVCANINAGRYREALVLADRWSLDARTEGTRLDPNGWALVEINLTEAEYNLGDLDAAERRLTELTHALRNANGPFRGAAVHEIVEAGLRLQRAWLHCLRKDADAAQQELSFVDKKCLPAEYRAEVEFTRALALATAKRFAEARDAMDVGLREATRASSRRNGLFLKATIASWSGALAEACEHFEAAAAHKYKGQGGDALLAWGQTLAALGRADEACAAWRLCAERDPQSGAATQAQAAGSHVREARTPAAL